MTTERTPPSELPAEFELEVGVDAPLAPQERQELEQLGTLLRAGRDFDLAPAARARGRAELEALLGPRRGSAQPSLRRSRARPWLWASVPLAAAILFAWLDPLDLRVVPTPTGPAELAVAQSALLTAELTGAPIPRDDLDRATRAYRETLLATLEQGR